MNRLLVALLLAGTVSSPAIGQDLSGFTKVLLPAYTSRPVAGANGASFRSVLQGFSGTDVMVYPAGDPPAVRTQPSFDPQFRALEHGSGLPSGRFLYVEASGAGALSLQYFLQSSDAEGKALGQETALPVVRMPRSGLTRILALPVSPILEEMDGGAWRVMRGYRDRLLLRVYDWEGDGTSQVSVQQYHEGLFGIGSALGTPVVLTLSRRDGNDPSFAWYAELPIERCVPFSAHTPCTNFSMRIEITPLTEGVQYWPFVTATDNVTQHVTVYAPQ